MGVPVQTGAPSRGASLPGPGRSASASALAAAMAATAFGFGPVIVRAMSLAPWSIAAWRLWIGFAVLLAYSLVTRRRSLVAAAGSTMAAGALFGFHLISSFASFHATSIANATMIGALQPALVTLVAPRLFGERRTRRSLLASAGTLGGIVLVVLAAGDHDGASLSGDLWAVASLMTFVGYFLRVKRLRVDGLDTMSLMSGVMLWACVVATPLCLVAGGGIEGMSSRETTLMFVLVLGPGIVGQALLAWAHSHLPAAVSATFMVSSPVVSMAGSWVAFGDVPRPLQMIGSSIVLASLCGLTISTVSHRSAGGPLVDAALAP